MRDSKKTSSEGNAAVKAEDNSAVLSGACGENVSWTYDESSYVLTIGGTGSIDNFGKSGSQDQPWRPFRERIKKVVVGSGITRLGQSTFLYCSELTDVNIPDLVDVIGEKVFYGCTALPEVNLPANVTSIGGLAFYNCRSLRRVTIPDKVKTIAWGAFNGCSALSEVTIGSGVSSIGSYVFENCRSLRRIVIPEGVTSISPNAFSGCGNITILGYGGSYAETYAMANSFRFEEIPYPDDAAPVSASTQTHSDEWEPIGYVSESPVPSAAASVFEGVSSAEEAGEADSADETTDEADPQAAERAARAAEIASLEQAARAAHASKQAAADEQARREAEQQRRAATAEKERREAQEAEKARLEEEQRAAKAAVAARLAEIDRAARAAADRASGREETEQTSEPVISQTPKAAVQDVQPVSQAVSQSDAAVVSEPEAQTEAQTQTQTQAAADTAAEPVDEISPEVDDRTVTVNYNGRSRTFTVDDKSGSYVSSGSGTDTAGVSSFELAVTGPTGVTAGEEAVFHLTLKNITDPSGIVGISIKKLLYSSDFLKFVSMNLTVSPDNWKVNTSDMGTYLRSMIAEEDGANPVSADGSVSADVTFRVAEGIAEGSSVSLAVEDVSGTNGDTDSVPGARSCVTVPVITEPKFRFAVTGPDKLVAGQEATFYLSLCDVKDKTGIVGIGLKRLDYSKDVLDFVSISLYKAPENWKINANDFGGYLKCMLAEEDGENGVTTDSAVVAAATFRVSAAAREGAKATISIGDISGTNGNTDSVNARGASFTADIITVLTLRTDSVYVLDSAAAYLRGLHAGTKVSDVLAQFTNGSGASVFDVQNAQLPDDALVGTGCLVRLMSGDTAIDTLTCVVIGDVNGDGEIDSTDYLRIRKAFLGTYKLEGAYLAAADVNGDGEIDSTDYLRIRKAFLGTYEL